MMTENLKLLGFKVRDLVTGFVGVVTTISFDLYGCVQAVVTAEHRADSKESDSRWFDTKRLVATSDGPVMTVPTFQTIPGGERTRPLPPSQPL
jgi:hypothetical protein